MEKVQIKVAITEAAIEQIPRVERKTKQRWMTEDILDLREKRRRVKNNREKYEAQQKEIKKKCDEAKAHRINDKCRNIQLHCRKCKKTLKKSLERKPAHPQDVLSQKMVTTSFSEKKKNLNRWAEYTSKLSEDHRKDYKYNVMKHNFVGPLSGKMRSEQRPKQYTYQWNLRST